MRGARGFGHVLAVPVRGAAQQLLRHVLGGGRHLIVGKARSYGLAQGQWATAGAAVAATVTAATTAPSYPYAVRPHRPPPNKRHRCRDDRWTQQLLSGQLSPPLRGGRVGGRHFHAAPDGRRRGGGGGGRAPIHEWGGGEGDGGGRVHRDTAGVGGLSAAGALRQYSCGDAGPTRLEGRWTGDKSERADTARSPTPVPCLSSGKLVVCLGFTTS